MTSRTEAAHVSTARGVGLEIHDLFFAGLSWLETCVKLRKKKGIKRAKLTCIQARGVGLDINDALFTGLSLLEACVKLRKKKE